MANELEGTLRAIAEKVGKFCDDAAKLTVRTEYQVVGTGAEVPAEARPAASTEIHLDADCVSAVPVRDAGNGQMAVETALWEIHERNVAAATETVKGLSKAKKAA